MKNSSDNELLPVCVGAGITGVVLSGVIGTTFAMESFTSWVTTFQALIAGCLALVGALFTVIFIQKQISLVKLQHDDLIERNLVAARSVLPMTLSELVRYGEDCLSITFDMALRRPIAKELLRPSEAVFEVFREVIKYAPEQRQSEMAELLAHLQIQVSRITSEIDRYQALTSLEKKYPNRVPLGDWNDSAHNYILDAAKLVFQSEDLFNFARRKRDEIDDRSGKDRFTGLFVRIHLNSDEWPKLIKSAEKRFS